MECLLLLTIKAIPQSIQSALSKLVEFLRGRPCRARVLQCASGRKEQVISFAHRLTRCNRRNSLLASVLLFILLSWQTRWRLQQINWRRLNEKKSRLTRDHHARPLIALRTRISRCLSHCRTLFLYKSTGCNACDLARTIVL